MRFCIVLRLFMSVDADVRLRATYKGAFSVQLTCKKTQVKSVVRDIDIIVVAKDNVCTLRLYLCSVYFCERMKNIFAQFCCFFYVLIFFVIQLSDFFGGGFFIKKRHLCLTLSLLFIIFSLLYAFFSLILFLHPRFIFTLFMCSINKYSKQ